MGSLNLKPDYFAIVDQNAPGVNDHSSASVASYRKRMLVHFSLPGSLIGQKITDFQLLLNVLSAGTGRTTISVARAGDFDPEAVTYSSMGAVGAFDDTTVSATGFQAITPSGLIGMLPNLCIKSATGSFATPAADGLSMQLSYQEAELSLDLLFDGDNLEVRTIDPAEAHRLVWIIRGADFGAPEQLSAAATITDADGSTRTISISGSADLVEIPADYLHAGSSAIKVMATLADGQILESQTITATVLPMEIVSAAPDGGYVQNEAAAIFSWRLRRKIAVTAIYSAVTAAGGTFQWRDSAAGTIHSLTIPAGANSITIPAATLPDSDGIQWRLFQLKSAAEDAITSDWYAITTLEALSSAAAISPVDTTADGTKPILFTWSHSIPTGTAPTGFELQKSTDGATWESFADENATSATQYSAPAGLFPAGRLFWRVRTRNTEGAEGEWSSAAEITIISAPPTPAITIVRQEPRFEIRWATSGQQSFEIMIDGALYAYVFSTEGNFRFDDFLPDGEHSAAVRVQNSLGLWSQWGMAALSIQNTPGAGISLLASSLEARALLAWSGGAYDEYWIYRDGARIGRTTETRFSDDFSGAKNQYSVIGFKAGSGNYTKSNDAEAGTPIRGIYITDVHSRERAFLRFAEMGSRILSIRNRREVSYTHYAGSALPEAEAGESHDKYYEISAAFRPEDAEEAEKFGALLGHLVCVRDMKGARIFGIFDELQIRDNLSYIACAATVRAVRYREGES